MSTLYHSEQPSPIPTTSGIYKITCVPSGKFYIGSAVNLHRRKNKHFYELNHNKHDNIHLLRAWQKHGEEAFVFEVIEFVLPPFLIEREQYWLDHFRPFGDTGFNMAYVAGSRLGMKNSPEAIEKTRAANLGKKRTPEAIEKAAAARRGKPSTRIGYKASPETIEKLRISHLGKKQSDELIRKRTSMLKGRKRSPEAIEKTRLANLGRKNTPEAIARMSAAKKGQPSNPECHANQMKTYVLTSPDGTEYVVHGIKRFCKEHNLNASNLIQVAKGKVHHAQGWKARYAD